MTAVLLPGLAALDLVLLAAAATGPALIRLGDVAWTLSISSLIVAATLLLAHSLTPGRSQISLIALLGVLAFGTLGDVAEGLRQYGTLDRIGGEFGLVALYVLCLAGPILAIRRGHRSLQAWYRYAVTVLVVLGAVSTFRLIKAALTPPSPPLKSAISLTGPRPGRPPDIWLLLMDKYSATPILRSTYGLDDRPFEIWLREHGFLLPAGQHANYPQTFLVLSSLLNFRYLDDYPDRFRGQTRLAAIPDIENNRLVAFLRARGYQFVFSPSAFDVTRQNRYADRQIPDPAVVRPELMIRWYRATAIPLLHRLACAALHCEVMRSPYVPESLEVQEAKFAALERFVPEQPTFVLAHFLLPHEPYLYRADCSPRPPYWPDTDSGADAVPQREAYREQVECTDRHLEKLVQAIRQHASVPPIILIQSDHGHGRLGWPVPSLKDSPPDRVEERISPFSAYALPGLPSDSLYPGITPINVIRLLLRYYFGADTPPLEDRTYWADTWRPYEFDRIR
jgi:hypothetical protein